MGKSRTKPEDIVIWPRWCSPYVVLSFLICGDESLAWDLLIAERKRAKGQGSPGSVAPSDGPGPNRRNPALPRPAKSVLRRPVLRYGRPTNRITCPLKYWTEGKNNQVSMDVCPPCDYAERILAAGVLCTCPWPSRELIERLQKWRSRDAELSRKGLR